MRHRLVGSILAGVAVLAFSPVIRAQTMERSGAAKARTAAPQPDLSGIWMVTGRGGRRFSREDPPLQPGAMQIFKANRKGVTDPNEQGLDELDPTYNCAPPGPTRAMVLRQFEIVQLPKQVLLLFEWDHWVRRIFLDGREHPEGYPFGWMGHSLGKWDGDTLVVDTVGVNDKTWLDGIGTPHSDALHVVERFRRMDHDTMEIDFTFDDPKAFTKPWGGKKAFQLRPDLEILEHINCEEYLEKYLEEMGKKR